MEHKLDPYARLRPGTVLAEILTSVILSKLKSTIGIGSKVNHLTYIGDAEIGSKKCWCSSVTCNYDGVNKFKTVIGNNVLLVLAQ